MTTELPSPTSHVGEPLISIEELAEWIGVSRHTVRKWAAQGPTTGLVPRMFRVNGQIRFQPQHVRDWLATKEIR